MNTEKITEGGFHRLLFSSTLCERDAETANVEIEYSSKMAMGRYDAEITSCAAKIISRCEEIAQFSETTEGITRTFLCEAMRGCHLLLTGWMKALGMSVSVDAIGNLHGVREGAAGGALRLLIGSHLDTVRDAGAFDGVLGVVVAIGLIELLRSKRLPFAIEIIGFSEEEGVRFGIPFLGSRALVGRIDDALLETRDRCGTSIREAIQHFGLDPSNMKAARLDGRSFAFLEFHIEQGPVLDSLGQPLGIVQAIAGQSRWSLTFKGEANHAGTTPMHLRRDALAGAAEWITAVEMEAHSVPGLVATVGSLDVRPGTSNVITGLARASLDVRHASDGIRIHAIEGLLKRAEQITKERGLSLDSQLLLNQPAVEMDSILVETARRAAAKAGCDSPVMISGAGHDAMIMAEKISSVMFFVRSPGGISHHPDETVRATDLEVALAAGMNFLEELAARSQ